MIYDVTGKSTDVQKYSVDGFTAGIDQSKNEADIDDKALSDVSNMWLDGGKIKTRPGSQCIFGCEVSDDNASSVRVIYSGNVIRKDYIGLKILVMQLEYTDKIVLKLIIQSDNGISKCIMLNTTNKADYDGDITLNCMAFSDSKIYGCGIYLLVGVIDEDLNVLDKRIYELAEDMNAFSVISQTEIYAPMVYVNGKGNKYYTLTKTDRNYPAGSKLEDANLLTGAFRAAYKTDGVSNSFMLPYKIIGSGAGQSITVKFTEADGTVKTFTIPNNATVSNTVMIGEDSVYAGINRLTGKLSFYKTGAASFALPYVDDVYNNLEIKAYRAFTDDRLFLMRRFENYGSHVFLFGSLDEPSKIYWSSQKHPLYFPVGSCQDVGDGFQSVTAMAKQNNLLIIFKSHEIYYISGVKDNEYDIDEVLCGNVRSVSCSSSVTVNQQNGSIGCKYPETVLLCANRLVFLGSDRCVYALTSTAMSQKQVYMISRQINSKIVENIYKAFAIRYEGRYLLYIDGTVFLFDYNTKMFKNVAANLGDTTADKTVNWFVWDFSGIYGSIFGGFDFEGKALMMSISNIATENGTKRIILQVKLGGERDVTHIVDGNNAVYADFQQDICGYIATKMMNFGSDCRKNIVKLDFQIDASENDISKAKLFLCTENGKKQLNISSTAIDKCGKICVLPLCNNVRKMKLEIGTFGAAIIGGLEVTYKQL